MSRTHLLLACYTRQPQGRVTGCLDVMCAEPWRCNVIAGRGSSAMPCLRSFFMALLYLAGHRRGWPEGLLAYRSRHVATRGTKSFLGTSEPCKHFV